MTMDELEANLKKVSDAVDKIDEAIGDIMLYEGICDLLPALKTFKEKFYQEKAEYDKIKRERDELVLKYHPDGEHNPVNMECPVCQKVLEKIEREALEACENKEDKAEHESKFKEIMLKKYGYEVIFDHEEK